MNYEWIDFDKGESIGEIGSEGGMIILDEENTFGARVTLEGKGYIAPFSITLGIYGLMFHTEFFSDLEQGQKYFAFYKRKIDDVITHYSVSDDRRDEKWSKKHDELIAELIDVSTKS
jgi:hypothetical protein